MGSQSLDGWPDDRVPRHVEHRITTTEAALELCRRGRAVAVFPAFLVGLHNSETVARMRLVQLSDPSGVAWNPLPVYLASRPGDDNGHTQQLLARAIARACVREPA